jgi:hypothetical protein
MRARRESVDQPRTANAAGCGRKILPNARDFGLARACDFGPKAKCVKSTAHASSIAHMRAVCIGVGRAVRLCATTQHINACTAATADCCGRIVHTTARQSADRSPNRDDSSYGDSRCASVDRDSGHSFTGIGRA